MGSGEINAIVANLANSFKIGALTKLQGTLFSDQTVGIAGRKGEPPAMVPIDLRVTYADGSEDEVYHFEGVRHPQLTPLICGVVSNIALASKRDLPQYHTLQYQLELEFANGKTLRIDDASVNASIGQLFYEI